MFSQTLDNDKGYDNSRNDNYGNTTAAYADAEPVGVSNNGESNPFLVKKQPTRCRDPLFAVLLLVNVAAIVGVTIRYSGDVIKSFTEDDADADANADADADAEKIDYTGIIYTAIATAAIASGLSAVTMQVMICIPGILIKAALFFNIGLSLVMAALGFLYGGIIAGIIGIVFFALMVCYARAVWSRIPFATANLKTGCAAIRANCGVTIISYIITAVAFAWSVLWSLCVAGVQDKLYTCDENDVCSNPNYGLLFLLFLSFFFTHQVLQNCVHVTVAGVTGTWWFNPQESGFCSGAVFGALGRTFTTSFGSICFGSLLVAIIQATRQLAESARQNDDVGQLLACCVDCILSCLESILEYFNKWAFVYVGLYGYGYCEAGKNVIQLFKDRGWEAIIADDLVGMVLFMVSLIVGLVTGGLAMSFVSLTNWFDNWPYKGPEWVAFAVGLVVGLVLCSILMSVIASSVNATIVLFAEGPAEFEKNHPELSAEMREAWQSAHPGCF
jgi:hypothetical protein